MSRAALHGGPRATSPKRQDLFQNLLLTTLAVVASTPVKSFDFGRPVQQRQVREDIQQQPFQLRAFQGSALTFRVQTPDLGDAQALRAPRGEVQPRNFQFLTGTIPPNPVVSADFSRPLAIRGQRSESAGQNLPLTTVAASAVFANLPIDRGQPLRINRDDVFPNLQFILPPLSSAFGGWDEGQPIRLQNRKDDPQPRNLVLSSVPAPTPIVSTETSRGAQQLRVSRAEASGTNFLLFPIPAYVPAFGSETSNRPQQIKSSRADVAPLNLPLLGASFGAQVPSIVFDLSGRPQQLRVSRTDVLGSPYGLIQQTFAPFINQDMGRPHGRANRPDDVLGSRFSFALPVANAFNPDLGRPHTLRTVRDDAPQQSFLLLPYLPAQPTGTGRNELIAGSISFEFKSGSITITFDAGVA